MDKRNHFSDKFESKSSEELRQIISNKDYQKEAQLAAIWELERREEANITDQEIAEIIVTTEAREKESIRQSRRYETFGARFIAAILDSFVLIAIGLGLNYSIPYTNSSILNFLSEILYNTLPFIYYILMHGYYGQTLGKMAMKVKVVDFESEQKIGLFQAFLRDCIPLILMILSFIVLSFTSYSQNNLFGLSNTESTISNIAILTINGLSMTWSLIELVSMLTNEKSRAVHDLIAKTVVIRTD